jgi:hypothetical protein
MGRRPKIPRLAARCAAATVTWTLVFAALGAGAAGAAGAAQAAAGPGPYFSAPFQVRTNSSTFGQTPSWTTTGGVLSNEPDRAQIEQVYSSRLNGSRRSCLTCGRLPGPNGFPAQRRQGHWILFCSVGVQPEHFGAPCLGGYGSDLYAIRPDGSDVTRLTSSRDPAGGGRYDDRYMSLHGRGVSPQHPRVTHLTDDDPAYEEQAVFTPDMRDVIVMTSRARPGTWYQTVITAALWTGFDASDPGSAGTPMFLADFSDPRFTADLSMVDVATRAVRQLTNFGHVIPEFAWNFDYTRLLWSGNARPDSHITRIGTFAGITAAQRRIPRTPAPVVSSSLGLLLGQLHDLAALTAVRIGQPTLSVAGL